MSHPKFSIFIAEYNILEMGPFAQTSDRAVQAAAKGRLTRPCPQRDSAAATGVAEPWSSCHFMVDSSHTCGACHQLILSFMHFCFPFFFCILKEGYYF